MSRLLVAVLLLGSVACTTLPQGIEKNPAGGVKMSTSGAIFPDKLNDHERIDDSESYEIKPTYTSVRYTHSGYGAGFSRWMPLVMPAYATIEGKVNEEKDIRSSLAKTQAENVVVIGYPFKVGNKNITIWSGKGESNRVPNKDVIVVAEKVIRIDYRFLAAGKGFLLETYGSCTPNEQKYFDADIKKSFEDFVLANAHLFK